MERDVYGIFLTQVLFDFFYLAVGDTLSAGGGKWQRRSNRFAAVTIMVMGVPVKNKRWLFSNNCGFVCFC